MYRAARRRDIRHRRRWWHFVGRCRSAVGGALGWHRVLRVLTRAFTRAGIDVAVVDFHTARSDAVGQHTGRGDQRHQQPAAHTRRGVVDGVLQHEQSPFQVLERGRCASQAGGHRKSHAETQQQATVVLRFGTRLLQYLDIAGGFAMERVLAHRPARQWMEEEHALRDGRHPAEPQIAASQMGQFVRECHRRFGRGQRVLRRQQHQRPPQAGDLRRHDGIGLAQFGAAAQAEHTCLLCAERVQGFIVQRCRVADHVARFAPLTQGEQQLHRHAEQPQRHQRFAPWQRRGWGA